ncbi:MAG: hypothetical protein R2757_20530 [Draconibacterium sp.]
MKIKWTVFLFASMLLIYIGCTLGKNKNFEGENDYVVQPGISMENSRVIWNVNDSLPSPYANSDGTLVKTTDEWEARRALLLKMLEDYVYGPKPVLKLDSVSTSAEYQDTLVSENAITYFARLYYGNSRYFTIRVTRPEEKKNYPVIIRYENNDSFRFPIEPEYIGNSKYVIVALNFLTVAPDNGEVTERYMYETKVLMAWAYAASLTVDYLESLDYVDSANIIIAGMSRTGKAAICAGIYDKRFKIIVANNSGAAGASGFRNFGERGTQAINIVKHQPTWVSAKLLEYLDDAGKLPLDMHFARALIAPRIILTTEAADGADAIWAGPMSTFKMWKASDYAFQLYKMTENNLIHLRAGGHEQLDEDYQRMMMVVNYICYGDSIDISTFRKFENEKIKN